MNILLPLLILIILAVIYAGSLNNSRTRLYVVVAILVLILGLCWVQFYANKHLLEQFSGLTGYAPINYKSNCDGVNFMQINNQLSSLGSFDGIVLPNNIKTAPLMKNVFITSPIGDDVKLTEDPSSNNFPTVDGTPNSNKHLFMFANNNFGGDCHSQYSTDRGMVCLSPEQLGMFMHRNKNLTQPQEYPSL